jgi:1-deoxy-D-xylulose-5-phosphate reductoisomerase
MPKRIAVLGSTGSIGTQALEIISQFPGEFSIEVLTAGNNIDLLISQARKFNPDIVVIGNDKHYHKLKDNLKDLPIKVYAGNDAINQVVAGDNIDIVITAIVGYSGLCSTVAAVKAGKHIALANKETLVVAGSIIKDLVKQSGSVVVPVDSEHSAIFQCLIGEAGNPIEKITLTASGGPFRNYSIEQLRSVTPADALNHPIWNMGSKITVDSASLMNKGLEVIEAKWLFDIEPSQIDVVIHPQSVIHSLVHFCDGSVKAQLGLPDMKLPIIYALSYPERLSNNLPRLNLSQINNLSFDLPDKKKFRNLALAFIAIEQGGNMPCILNAANEIAVDAFLNGRIGFHKMSDVVEHTMGDIAFSGKPDLLELEHTDRRSREVALAYINKQTIKK